LVWHDCRSGDNCVRLYLLLFKSANAFLLDWNCFGVVVLPFIIGIAMESGRSEKINEMFLEFTRNLAETVATGTPVSKGIINMRKKRPWRIKSTC